MHSELALQKCLELPDIRTVLDIGTGRGEHAKAFRVAGKQVLTIDTNPKYQPDVLAGYPIETGHCFDLVWSSHSLEHSLNPHEFIKQMKLDCKPYGYIAITVPPLKHQIVGGHVSLWNGGLMLYHLVLGGVDCRHAMIKQYGYNISVIVQNNPAPELAQLCGQGLSGLRLDHGDISALARWLPKGMDHEGFNGDITSHRWDV